MPITRQTPIRVVIVDDSPSIRDLLASLLQNAGDIQVVGTGANGEDALRLAKRLHPDLITLDMCMPKVDGVEATRTIMRECPTPILILSASMKHSETDLTFRALQAGALAVLGKPGLDDEQACEEIVQTVRTMADVPVIHHWGRGNADKTPTGAKQNQCPTDKKAQTGSLPTQLKLSEIDIVGIAASTGGPSAVAAVLQQLSPDFPLPILVVQHISPGFATGLADWLATQVRMRVELAAHEDVLQPGVVLLAPDDYHIQVNETGKVELTKAPPYKGLRPSANFLFDSLARVFGPHAMGLILTGMGDDGANGIKNLHDAGGLTIAQDEESCVVYGMPREAVMRNAIDHILTLDQAGALLIQLALAYQSGETRKRLV